MRVDKNEIHLKHCYNYFYWINVWICRFKNLLLTSKPCLATPRHTSIRRILFAQVNHRECATFPESLLAKLGEIVSRERTEYIWCKYIWSAPNKSEFTSRLFVFMGLKSSTSCCRNYSSVFPILPEKLLAPFLVPKRIANRRRSGRQFICI